jgi:hypothetical protein
MSARRQGGPPPDGRGPITLAEWLHEERKRVLIYTAKVSGGYKHVVAKRLRISRPHLDKWIALYGIREHFRTNTVRTAPHEAQ